LVDGRPIKHGGRAFEVLMALIEASGAVVSKDELLSVWQGRIVGQNRQLGTRFAALSKGLSADRELIPMAADRVRAARSPSRRLLAEFADEVWSPSWRR
jgi:hypothetical protein